MRLVFLTLMFCSSLFIGTILVGCQQSASTDSSETAETSSKVVNEVCPIMGGDVTEEGGTVVWNGKLIGFCCPGCAPKWEELSDDEKAGKLAATQVEEEGESSHTVHDQS